MFKETAEGIISRIGTLEAPIFFKNKYAAAFEIGDSKIEIYDENMNVRDEYVNKALFRANEICSYFNFDILIIRLCYSEKDIQLIQNIIGSAAEETFSEIVLSEDNEEYSRVSLYWSTKKINLDRLFREIIKTDIGGYSILSSSVFLLDSKKSCVCHLYDDRGIDIIASSKETIYPIYKKYENWLIDREKTDELFMGDE